MITGIFICALFGCGYLSASVKWNLFLDELLTAP